MTLAEKILTAKIKSTQTAPGQILDMPVDWVIGTDVMVPLAVKAFEKMGAGSIFDPAKLIFTNDHFVPAKDITAARFAKIARDFARKHAIKNFLEIGRSGICHISIPEMGFVAPGEIIIGADSHTCTLGALGTFSVGVGTTDMAAAWALGRIWLKIPESIKVVLKGQLSPYVTGKDVALQLLKILGSDGALYKVIEFSGPALNRLCMADRFTLCNMTSEMGAKTGIFPADEITREYLDGRTAKAGIYFEPDKDAVYCESIEMNLSEIPLLVAAPPEPSNVYKMDELKGIKIDQVVIGSCTNGRIEDFRMAWSILKGHSVAEHVRLILLPGSPQVLKQIVRENMLEDFINAGAVIGPSTCGPCVGGHLGVLADEETGLFTTSRNFTGRNGAKSAKVYLCGPAVAAFSAICGYIDFKA